MRRYEKISGTVFTLIALAQLTRAILGLPAQVGTTSIPIWVSIVAFLVTGGLAIWGFRSSRSVA
jgi:hypothetical protein